MKYSKDQAIVLSRTDFAEKDRILTLFCRDHGKIKVIAKGARSQKSRLAGGIEVLSLTEVNFLGGRSDIYTLTSARLVKHFKHLSRDINVMQQAFSYIMAINKITEVTAGQEYFDTLLNSLENLDDTANDPRIVDIWFNLQILSISGSSPDMTTSAIADQNEFEFDYDRTKFFPKTGGPFTRNDLKLLRLGLSLDKPPKLANELGSEDRLLTLTRTLLKINVTEV